MVERVHEGQESDMMSSPIDSDVRRVVCPNCSSEVPLTQYCLKCGFPMYSLGKDILKGGPNVYTIDERVEDDSPVGLGSSLDFRSINMDIQDMERLEERDRDLSQGEGRGEPSMNGYLLVPDAREVSDFKSMEGVEILVDERPFSIRVPSEKVKLGVDGHVPDLSRPVAETDYKPEAADVGLMEDLSKSAMLVVWSIGELLEDGISEEDFKELFTGYEKRWRLCNERRREALAQLRDMDSLVVGLKRASLRLKELEVRKSIDDLFEGEYEAKSSAYAWEVDFFEREIKVREGKISFLEDLGGVASVDDVSRVVGDARDNLDSLSRREGTWEHSDELYDVVRSSLEDVVLYLSDGS